MTKCFLIQAERPAANTEPGYDLTFRNVFRCARPPPRLPIGYQNFFALLYLSAGRPYAHLELPSRGSSIQEDGVWFASDTSVVIYKPSLIAHDACVDTDANAVR